MKRSDLAIQGIATFIIFILSISLFGNLLIYLSNLAKLWPGSAWLSVVIDLVPWILGILSIVLMIIGVTGNKSVHMVQKQAVNSSKVK